MALGLDFTQLPLYFSFIGKKKTSKCACVNRKSLV